ncbi:MAG: hypothetical protein ACPHIZ_07740, partial [Acidimicrobiales bacterium]
VHLDKRHRPQLQPEAGEISDARLDVDTTKHHLGTQTLKYSSRTFKYVARTLPPQSVVLHRHSRLPRAPQ